MHRARIEGSLLDFLFSVSSFLAALIPQVLFIRIENKIIFSQNNLKQLGLPPHSHPFPVTVTGAPFSKSVYDHICHVACLALQRRALQQLSQTLKFDMARAQKCSKV